MRGLLVFPFLLIAGTSAEAQSFSFNVGGQPIHVSMRGHCAECISVVVPGYVEYNRPRYYDYEVPYVGRSPRAGRTAQKQKAQKRHPEVAMVRDPLAAQSAPGRAAPPVAAVAPMPQAPVAPQPKPDIAAAPSAAPQVTMPQVATPPAAIPTIAAPAAVIPAPVPVAPVTPPVAAAAPLIAPSPAPAPELRTTISPSTPAVPAQQEIAAVQPALPPPSAAPASDHAAAPAVGSSTAAPPAPPSIQPAPQPAPKPAAEKKPAVIAALPPAKEVEPRAKPSATSPVGVWSSSEGQMRVENCGKNICSYAVGGPHAGKMILKNMRQTSDNRWAGQVTDIRSGQTYSAHMSMRGPNALNIQGCALGGLVCGGRTLTRTH